MNNLNCKKRLNSEYQIFRISFTNLQKIKEERERNINSSLPKNDYPSTRCGYCNNSFKFDMLNEKCQYCGRFLSDRKQVRKEENKNNHNKNTDGIPRHIKIKQFKFFNGGVNGNIQSISKERKDKLQAKLKLKKDFENLVKLDNDSFDFPINFVASNNSFKNRPIKTNSCNINFKPARVDKMGIPIIKGEKNHKVSFKDEHNLNLVEYIDSRTNSSINSDNKKVINLVENKNDSIIQNFENQCKCIIM